MRLVVTTCLITAATLLGVMSCSSDNESAASTADHILKNGVIYTVDPEKPWAEAVVIRDGKFIYVGDDAGTDAFSAEQITDLGGRFVLPGLVDAHTHPGQIDLIQYGAMFDANRSDTFIAQLEAYAAENQGDDWLRACCWPVIAFVNGDKGPDRIELDRIFPERPVWITSNAGHSNWLNSRALEELGLDGDTPDPRFPVAIYKRDETGRLTGWVKEGAGWQIMDDVFAVDPEIHEASMRDMLQTLSAHGVTTLYDAGTKEFSDRVYAFMSRLERAGELPLRYEGTYRISTPDRRDIAIAEMKRFRAEYGGDLLRFNTIKLFMDGIHENRSGAMLEPYSDDPDYVSDTTLSIDELRDFLLRLHEERFDLHVHVIGDLAAKSVLDAVEQAQAAIGEDFYPRVSLGHLQNTDPGDWPRFAALGVSANFTPWWHGPDQPDPAAAALGHERMNDTYRAKALLDVGANVTFSSDDWSLNVLSPFLGMQVGHTRQFPREWLTGEQDPDRFRHPASEKVPLAMLVKGYTLNGAYQLRMEDQLGSIEVGKVADLVVLDENLFEVDPYALNALEPSAVFVNGKQIQGHNINRVSH